MPKSQKSAKKRPKSPKPFDFKAALTRVAEMPEGTFAQILFSAEVLFAERGFSGVGIRDIADDVGINVSTLHFHWRSKAVLYEAVCRYQTAMISKDLTSVFDGRPVTPETLDEAVQSMIRLLTHQTSIAPMVLQSVTDQEFPELAGLKKFDTALFENLAKRLGGVAGKGSVAREFPDLTFLTLYYALVLLFANGAPQQALLGGSLFDNGKLQARIGKFASRLVEQVTCD